MGKFTRGKSFGEIEEVSAADLHQLIEEASINETIITAEITDNAVTNDKIYTVSAAKLTDCSSLPAGSGIFPTANGSTGLSSFSQGDILYASSASVLAKLTKDANESRYLSNQGTTNNPQWEQVDLATGVTGVLPMANGGFPSNIQAFTSSGTWTKPAGVSKVWVKAYGGGGGGGGVAAGYASGGGGGGGGAYAEGLIAVTGNVTVTVGLGGAGGTQVADGAAGGNTTFAGTTTLTANGGGAGLTNGTAGTGGAASNGSINLSGGDGQAGISTYSGYGGDSGFGGHGQQGNYVNATGGIGTSIGKGGFPGGGGAGGGRTGAGTGGDGLVIVYY